MKGNRKKFYSGKTPFQRFLRALGWVLLALVVIAFFLYFYLQKFIVITDDGLHLSVPGISENYSPSPDLVIEE